MSTEGKSPLDNLKRAIRKLFKRNKAATTNEKPSNGATVVPAASTTESNVADKTVPALTADRRVSPSTANEDNISTAAVSALEPDDDNPPAPPPKNDAPDVSALPSRTASIEVPPASSGPTASPVAAPLTSNSHAVTSTNETIDHTENSATALAEPVPADVEPPVQKDSIAVPPSTTDSEALPATAEQTNGTIEEDASAARRYMDSGLDEKTLVTDEDGIIPVDAERTHLPAIAKANEGMSATSGPLEDFPMGTED